jgi:negative regulator of flagellin synthesis FlgM
MNIGKGIENLTQIFPSQATAAPSRSGSQQEALPADKAQLSAAGTQAAQSPADSDVRLDKVAAIQNALAAGTYGVPASAVAEKVVSALLASKK